MYDFIIVIKLFIACLKKIKIHYGCQLGIAINLQQHVMPLLLLFCIILTVNGVLCLFIDLLQENAFINIAIPYCSIVHASLVTSFFLGPFYPFYIIIALCGIQY